MLINYQRIVLWVVAIGTGVAFCGSVILNIWNHLFHAKSTVGSLSVTVHNPSSSFQIFDTTSQQILAVGCLIFLSCWGVSKVLTVWK